MLIIGEHTGTHCDAPCHAIPPPLSGLPHAGPAGAITVDKIPLEQSMGPAAVIDCRDLKCAKVRETNSIISVDKVKEWESKYGELMKGEIVLFYTGWCDLDSQKLLGNSGPQGVSEFLNKRKDYPALNGETLEYLYAHDIRHVGIDLPSVGSPQADVQTHRAGLSKGLVFVENLINLGELPPRGAYYIFLPLKIEGGSGAPGRAVAFF